MAKGNTLTRIKKFHPELIAEPDWVLLGLTPDRRSYYEETRKRSRSFPKLDPEGQGMLDDLREQYPDYEQLKDADEFQALCRGKHRQWALNPMTAQPLYPLNFAEVYDHVRTFYLESQGNGNIDMIDWRPPTQEEIKTAERDGKILEMQTALATAFVDSEYTPEMLLDIIRKGGSGIEPVTEDQAEQVKHTGTIYPEPNVEYPHMYAPGRWRLSDGSVVEGKRTDAEPKEAEIVAARDQAKAKEGF